MRVLFYLPVVTPWWFDNKIAPMIRAIARDAEVSVMVPPLWRNTGIGPAQLAGCSDIGNVQWYILDGEDHPRLRVSAIDEADLFELVRYIDPDLTLCRSADLETPARFPGIVRYIMEGGAPPFAVEPTWAYLSATLFDHAILPAMDADARRRLDTAFRPEWEATRRSFRANDRHDFLAAAGLPQDRKIIGLPLEYEHREMFFGQHNIFGSNVELVDSLAARLDEDSVLAITNHPLNELYCDNRPLIETIDRHAGKVRLVRQIGEPGDATMALARHCDGMIVGNSKSFGGCAFFGTPMLRLSGFRTGDWMRAYDALEPFLEAIRSGSAVAADEADARTWFAFHLFNNVFDPADPALSAAGIADRAIAPVNEARWEAALARRADIDLRLAA